MIPYNHVHRYHRYSKNPEVTSNYIPYISPKKENNVGHTFYAISNLSNISQNISIQCDSKIYVRSLEKSYIEKIIKTQELIGSSLKGRNVIIKIIISLIREYNPGSIFKFRTANLTFYECKLCKKYLSNYYYKVFKEKVCEHCHDTLLSFSEKQMINIYKHKMSLDVWLIKQVVYLHLYKDLIYDIFNLICNLSK